MGSAERHWSDMVSRQIVKRDIIGRLWRTPVSDSPSLALEAEQLITGGKDRLSCVLSETVSQHLPIGYLQHSHPNCDKVSTDVAKYQAGWGHLIGWPTLAGNSWQGPVIRRKLLLRTENGSSALSWGFFQRQMRTVSGCRADWRDKEDFGGSQNARIHNYVHAITFTTPSQEKDFLWTVSMRCHSFCFSETSKHY